ncbi:MAG TPA: hypothetical protein VGI40_06630 [Pirellulaceae bacterium]|jgi:cytochrome c551/c552
MPATETTWRNTGRLHQIFALTGVLLTVGTIWMFWKDHARSWKHYQVQVNNVDIKVNELRQQQYETSGALLAKGASARELAEAKARPIDSAHLEKFKTDAGELDDTLKRWKAAGHPYSLVTVDQARIEQEAKKLADLSQKAADERKQADAADKVHQAALADLQAKPSDEAKKKAYAEAESKARKADQDASAAEKAAATAREKLVAEFQRIVDDARVREDKALGIRKFKNGEIDAAKANVDIAIRDGVSTEAAEQKVNALLGDTVHPEADAEKGKQTYAALNQVFQTIARIRKDLEKTLKQITAETEAAKKRYDESIADLQRLKKQEQDREEKFVTWYDSYPFVLGKRILTLPILDAFGSPRKIENLWSDGLTQNYNFSYVRRFDRCTTCHQSLTKTLPGTSTTPAFVHDELVDFVVIPPGKDAPPKPRVDDSGNEIPLTLEDWLGLKLAHEGLLNADDVTVALVLPNSAAAKARINDPNVPAEQATGLEFRQQVAQLVSPPNAGQDGESESLYPKLPGLMLGDVITEINSDPLPTSGASRGPVKIARWLQDLAERGQPIHLKVRRGMPNPYISHPRLDLYLSDASPHRMQTFACTICHDGQGSATAFEWASHTPSTTLEMDRWRKEYGWFDNSHWIYPMYAKRFAEAACLKCHHDVVELEPSDKFADAPAAKVTHGYHLIRKYGCYGCHEVNGFDGPTRRVGPDLRSEPNYFAVAQQIEAELNVAGRASANSERLEFWKKELASLTAPVVNHPEESQPRLKLKSIIDEAVAAAGTGATLLDKSLSNLSNMLKDVEAPGALRRPGPSLRFIAQKADPTFLFDWIANPQHFRPTTRMPRFFGLWDHLKDSTGHMTDEKAPKLEPIEVRGILAYFGSYKDAQNFEPEPRPSGIDRWTEEERVNRGKTQFQTRGCLACHNHKDFPEVQKYRNPEEIVQGPDLSGVGTKFAKDRNPVGPDWLYSWIRNPTKYHARTVMPNLFLLPDKDLGADPNSAADDKTFDPADDIVTYLLASSKTDWQPMQSAVDAQKPLPEDDPALKSLILEYLNEAFYKDAADDYYLHGIPPHLEGELKGAEKDLIVQPGGSLTNAQRLKYIGRKTISKFGCFGCHDIPGFEDAKPIGTGLADWGRKDPAKLAFEHVTHYAVGHAHASHTPKHAAVEMPAGGATSAGESPGVGPSTSMPSPAARGEPAPGHESKSKTSPEMLYADSTAKSKDANPKEAGHALARAETEDFRSFYTHALEAGNRIGFIYQKLKEPRSYDYDKTENKRYNERLRMPQFPFSAEEREAVITFVIGLVADPPTPKYIYRARDRQAALVAGRTVLEKYNCGGCHVLGLEKWQISYNAGEMGERPDPPVYPFLKKHFSPQELATGAKVDRRDELHSTLFGLPPGEKDDGLPVVVDLDGSKLDNSSPYAERELKFGLELFQPAIVDGSAYQTGQQPVFASEAQIDARYPTWGGVLTKYLLPVVTELEKKSNPNASGTEAYGWVPPPLVNEGHKVQTAWLHDFLLDPYPIRPAVFLRMPRFNMSSSEATALANYFAAVDSAEFPYAYAANRDRTRLADLEEEYVKAGEGTVAAKQVSSKAPPEMQRLDDAMKIVVNGNFCVKCHLVGDFSPAGSVRAKAPQLGDVYRRLRPDYVRDWIANPKMILPYTAMPVNIPYQEPPAVLGELYHGSNVEQIQALTDLLMNYDQYARQSTKIADRVQPATPAPAGTGTGSN